MGTIVLRLSDKRERGAAKDAVATRHRLGTLGVTSVAIKQIDPQTAITTPGELLRIGLSVENHKEVAPAATYIVSLKGEDGAHITPQRFELAPGATKQVEVFYSVPPTVPPGDQFLKLVVLISVSGNGPTSHSYEIAYRVRRLNQPPLLRLRPQRRVMRLFPWQAGMIQGRIRARVANRSNWRRVFTITAQADPGLTVAAPSSPLQLAANESGEQTLHVTVPDASLLDERQRMHYTITVTSPQLPPVTHEGTVELVRFPAWLLDQLRWAIPLALGALTLLVCGWLLWFIPGRLMAAQAPTPTNEEAMAGTVVAEIPAPTGISETEQANTATALIAAAQSAAQTTVIAITATAVEQAKTVAAINSTIEAANNIAASANAILAEQAIASAVALQILGEVAAEGATSAARQEQLEAIMAMAQADAAATVAAQPTAALQPPQATPPPQMPALPTPTLPPQVRAIAFVGEAGGVYAAGEPIDGIAVQLTDGSRQVPVSDVPVRLDLVCIEGCAEAQLYGSTVARSQNGVAIFDAVTIQQTALYRLRARAGSLEPITSVATLRVTAGAPSDLALGYDQDYLQPSQLRVKASVVDSYGNLVVGFEQSGGVTISVLPDTAGSDAPLPLAIIDDTALAAESYFIAAGRMSIILNFKTLTYSSRGTQCYRVSVSVTPEHDPELRLTALSERFLVNVLAEDPPNVELKFAAEATCGATPPAAPGGSGQIAPTDGSTATPTASALPTPNPAPTASAEPATPTEAAETPTAPSSPTAEPPTATATETITIEEPTSTPTVEPPASTPTPEPAEPPASTPEPSAAAIARGAKR